MFFFRIILFTSSPSLFHSTAIAIHFCNILCIVSKEDLYEYYLLTINVLKSFSPNVIQYLTPSNNKRLMIILYRITKEDHSFPHKARRVNTHNRILFVSATYFISCHGICLSEMVCTYTLSLTVTSKILKPHTAAHLLYFSPIYIYKR